MHMGLRVEKELKEALEKEAKAQSRSLSNLIKIILEDYIKKCCTK